MNPDKYYKPDEKSNHSKAGSNSGSGTEGCYLTSACAEARGLPDQYEELQTLRFFRDEYLKRQPGWQAEVEQYYAIAPEIVNAINRLSNATAIWNCVFEELVAPCVRMIHADQNEAAHRLYKAYSLKLSRLYLDAAE